MRRWFLFVEASISAVPESSLFWYVFLELVTGSYLPTRARKRAVFLTTHLPLLPGRWSRMDGWLDLS